MNGKESNWMCLKAGVPQGSVLDPILFLVYINDLTDNISSDMRHFADDSSLFTRVKRVNQTHDSLVKDLQREMLFNPDLTKQAIFILQR